MFIQALKGLLIVIVLALPSFSQVLKTSDMVVKDNGIRYLVYWTASHKTIGSQPDAYGRLPLVEFVTENYQLFSDKAEAVSFSNLIDNVQPSTGTTSVLSKPTIKIVETKDNK